MNLHQKIRFQYIWKAVLLAFFICMSSVSYAADTDYVWVPYNDPTAGTELLPKFRWACGCAPTAVSMVLGYWDNYGPIGGGNWGKATAYGRLIDYYIDEDTLESYQGIDGVDFYWAGVWIDTWNDCPTRPKLIVDLAISMETTGGGGTINGDMEPGTNVVLNAKGYDNWAKSYWITLWGDIENSIDCGEPCEVNIPDHAVACFGYSNVLDKFATYDTNQEQRHDYDKNMVDNHVLRVSPENGNSNEDVNLKAPDGGENWEAESSQTISWYQFNGSRIDNVDIYYSTNGGKTFSTEATQVSTSYGWNYYTWNIPSGIDSTRMRIKIRGWEGGSACLSEDGSQENFTVLSPNQPPMASFTANPTSDESPLTVNFDGTASSDPDGTIDSYAWDFGDGYTGSDQITIHEYTSAGSYTVTLTVTDNQSATGAATDAITLTASDNNAGGGGSGGSGGCFIATATFGSSMEKYVTTLKDF